MTYSSVGRHRKLTQEQIDAILRWARERRTPTEVAAHYGISVETLNRIIRTGGQHYKRAARIAA